MRRRILARSTKGQSLVLVALMIVVLVGMVGLAIDGANLFMQRRNIMNVADAAALAATRAFLESKREGNGNSTTNTATYNAAADFIAEHLPSAATTFKVSYYLNNGNPANRYYTLTSSHDSSSLPSAKNGQELVVRGVEVEINYSFDTFFVQIMHIDTATVNAKGLGYFGYLGSVVGEDVVPLTLDMGAGNMLREGGQYSIKLFDTVPALLDFGSYDIYPVQAGMLHFTPNPDGQRASGCSGSDTSFQYTWCAGSATPVEIADELDTDEAPFGNSIKTRIQQRIASGRDVVLIPEYFGDPSTGQVTINSFIAVRLVRTSGNALVVEYVPYMYTSGSISGNGNGVPGAYAINLVR